MTIRRFYNSFQFMLEVAGYQVATFGSAFRLFLENASEPPACLILDQYMPDLTGIELVEHLRSVGSTMPILLITGLPSPRDQRAGRRTRDRRGDRKATRTKPTS